MTQNLPEKKSEGSADRSSGNNIGVYTRVLKWIHNRIFVTSIDSVICCIFVVISALALALGSGHPIGMLMWTCEYFSTKHDDVYWTLAVGDVYWTLAVGIAAPMAFILIGPFILWRCRTLIKRMEDEFGHLLKKEVTTADLKDEVGNDE